MQVESKRRNFIVNALSKRNRKKGINPSDQRRRGLLFKNGAEKQRSVNKIGSEPVKKEKGAQSSRLGDRLRVEVR